MLWRLPEYLSRRARSGALDQTHFNKLISTIWQDAGRPKSMGIALSGGADSMALTMLCEKSRQARNEKKRSGKLSGPARFRAFIIDHGVRPGSSEEAVAVKDEVRRKTKIDVDIIKLDWEDRRDPAKLENFETVARRMRYRALARACIEHGINVLLVGHHADDAAETILGRVHAGYTGTGLAGIQTQALIPECHNIYGAESGSPWSPEIFSDTTRGGGSSSSIGAINIESGGIQIHRPLLMAPKAGLTAICTENELPWFEDESNQDPTLTTRNAIRHLLEAGSLPGALRSESLLALGKSWQTKKDDWQSIADDHFRQCRVTLDLGTGSVDMKIPQTVLSKMKSEVEMLRTFPERQHCAALLLRRSILLCSPSSHVSRHDLEQPLRLAFPFLFPVAQTFTKGPAPRVAPVAGVLVEVAGPAASGLRLLIRRAPPSKQTPSLRLYEHKRPGDALEALPWRLFDNRWWIRLHKKPTDLPVGTRVVLRTLTYDEFSACRRDLDQDARRYLVALLKHRAPDKLRLTVPAMILATPTTVADGKRSTSFVETVVALPTLNWGLPGWVPHRQEDISGQEFDWSWEVNYKAVSFRPTNRHVIVQ